MFGFALDTIPRHRRVVLVAPGYLDASVAFSRRHQPGALLSAEDEDGNPVLLRDNQPRWHDSEKLLQLSAGDDIISGEVIWARLPDWFDPRDCTIIFDFAFLEAPDDSGFGLWALLSPAEDVVAGMTDLRIGRHEGVLGGAPALALSGFADGFRRRVAVALGPTASRCGMSVNGGLAQMDGSPAPVAAENGPFAIRLGASLEQSQGAILLREVTVIDGARDQKELRMRSDWPDTATPLLADDGSFLISGDGRQLWY